MRCGSERIQRDGQTRLGGQRWRCTACGHRFPAGSTSAFSRHAFPDDVLALAVRHSVCYRLSYADVVEWFAERGLVVGYCQLQLPISSSEGVAYCAHAHTNLVTRVPRLSLPR